MLEGGGVRKEEKGGERRSYRVVEVLVKDGGDERRWGEDDGPGQVTALGLLPLHHPFSSSSVSPSLPSFQGSSCFSLLSARAIAYTIVSVQLPRLQQEQEAMRSGTAANPSRRPLQAVTTHIP